MLFGFGDISQDFFPLSTAQFSGRRGGEAPAFKEPNEFREVFQRLLHDGVSRQYHLIGCLYPHKGGTSAKIKLKMNNSQNEVHIVIPANKLQFFVKPI